MGQKWNTKTMKVKLLSINLTYYPSQPHTWTSTVSFFFLSFLLTTISFLSFPTTQWTSTISFFFLSFLLATISFLSIPYLSHLKIHTWKCGKCFFFFLDNIWIYGVHSMINMISFMMISLIIRPRHQLIFGIDRIRTQVSYLMIRNFTCWINLNPLVMLSYSDICFFTCHSLLNHI